MEVTAEFATQLWQTFGKGMERVEFFGSLHLMPPRVILILLASGRIPPRRLKMALRIGTNPNILPSRWYHQRDQTPAYLAVPNRATVLVQKCETPSTASACPARIAGLAVAKAGPT